MKDLKLQNKLEKIIDKLDDIKDKETILYVIEKLSELETIKELF